MSDGMMQWLLRESVMREWSARSIQSKLNMLMEKG
jgi:hypothetical protein